MGDPCDISTGGQVETEVDYESPSLRFVRTYRSNLKGVNRGIGTAWAHTYSSRIVFRQGEPFVLVRPDGLEEPLQKSYPSQDIEYYSKAGSGALVRASGSEWVVYLDSGAREVYDSAGTLLKIVSAGGGETIVSYANGVIDKVTGEYGHELDFTFDASNQFIVKVTDPTGRDFYYGYSGDLLAYVVFQDQTWRIYHYEDAIPDHLTGITDEKGIRYLTVSYDDAGRVEWSERAGGTERIDVAYSNVAATATDADGYQTVVQFDRGGSNGRAWRLGSQPYATRQDAIDAARAVNTAFGTQYLTVVSETAVDTDVFAERKVDSISVDGGVARSFNYDNDYADHLEAITDENGVTTAFSHDLYHLSIRHEAQLEFGYDRVTRFLDYLNETSDLPKVVTQQSIRGSSFSRSVNTDYYAGTQNVHTITWKGFAPLYPALPDRITTYGNYNAAGQPGFIDGPQPGAGDTTLIEYYDELALGAPCTTGGECGQLKQVTNALGHVTTFDDYDGAGRLLQWTDPNGLVTSYTYDARGRVLTLTQDPTVGATRQMTNVYDAAGLLDTVTLPNGVVLEYTWSADHLLDYIEDAEGNRIDYRYDGRGNRTGEDLKDPGGAIKKALSMSYDAHSRPASLQAGSSAAATMNFDPVGNLEDATDANFNVTDYQYDPLNRVDKAIDALNGASAPTEYDYDNLDNVTSATAPNGANTQFEYDDFGNLWKEVSPDRGTTLYGYDEAGNRICKADGRYSAGYSICSEVPARTVLTYDALNRLKSIDYLLTAASPDVTYRYDEQAGQIGRLTSMTSVAETGGAVITSYTYDAFGNRIGQTESTLFGAGARSTTVAYAYDENDQVTQITYPNGRTVNYIRTNGRITSITTDSPYDATTTTLVSDVTYYPFGPPKTITYGNGLVQTRTLDTAYRPYDISLGDVGGVVDLREYSLDDAGNVTQINDVAQPFLSADYRYNALHQLIDDTYINPNNPGVDAYNYDQNGNRTARTSNWYGYPSQTIVPQMSPLSNRQVSVNAVPVDYDNAGNVVDNGLGVTALYDVANRLSSLIHSGVTTTHRYNGAGELAALVRTSNCTCNCQDSDEVYAFSPDGKLLSFYFEKGTGASTDYVWLDGLPIAALEEKFATDGSHQTGSSTLTYLHPDHLGTPRLGTDAGQVIVWRNTLDAFGHSQISTAGPDIRLRFPGQVDYQVGGIYYNYFRDYDSNTGRYLQSDPIGLAGGLNTYGYVGQNPLFWSDPLGLDATICLYPGARGFGHVGYGVNSSETYGFYPEGVDEGNPITGTPGIVKKDTKTPDSCKTISTTAEQDETLLDFLEGSKVPPFPDYMLTRNNCVDFVRQALDQAGIVTPETIRPKPFFENLPGVAVPSP